MTREEILKSTINIIQIVTHDEDLKEDTILNDLNMDSLDQIEIVIMLEKEFNIRIPDAKIEEEWNTVSSLVDIVEKLLAAKRH